MKDNNYKENNINCCYNCKHYHDAIDYQNCRMHSNNYPSPIGICDVYEVINNVWE